MVSFEGYLGTSDKTPRGNTASKHPSFAVLPALIALVEPSLIAVLYFCSFE